MIKVVCIVQARLGSNRLPGKVLMDICGKPMVQHVVERTQAIRGVNQVVIAVPKCDVPEFYVVRAETGCGVVYCDSKNDNDVLYRFASAAKQTKADIVVRITGDCPLIAPEVCATVLRAVTDRGVAFANNDTRSSGYPDGLDVECFRVAWLNAAHEKATDPLDREHVTRWLYRHCHSQQTLGREQDELSAMKLSVDTQDDLDRVRRIFARIPASDYSWRATQEAIDMEVNDASA